MAISDSKIQNPPSLCWPTVHHSTHRPLGRGYTKPTVGH